MMLGISSLLKNTWIPRNSSCNTWRRYISVNDRRRMNSPSQWRHWMTVHMEETPRHHILLRELAKYHGGRAHRAFLVCYLEDATTVFSFFPTQKFPSILPYPQPSYSNSKPSVFPHLWHHRPILLSVYQSYSLSTNPSYCNWLFFSLNFLYPFLQYAQYISFPMLLYI